MRKAVAKNKVKANSVEHSDKMSTCENAEKCDTPKKRKLKRNVQALHAKLWRKSQFKKLTHKVTVNNLICQL